MSLEVFAQASSLLFMSINTICALYHSDCMLLDDLLSIAMCTTNIVKSGRRLPKHAFVPAKIPKCFQFLNAVNVRIYYLDLSRRSEGMMICHK